MTERNDPKGKKVLSLRKGKLGLKKTGDAAQVRQSFSHGRSKTVQVEVRRKRVAEPNETAMIKPVSTEMTTIEEIESSMPTHLTHSEREVRIAVLKEAMREEEERKSSPLVETPDAEPVETPVEPVIEAVPEPEGPIDFDTLRAREIEQLKAIQEEDRQAAETAEAARLEEETRRKKVAAPETVKTKDQTETSHPAAHTEIPNAEDKTRTPRGKRGKSAVKPAPSRGRGDPRRRSGKLTITQALNEEAAVERVRSLAAMKRARARERGKFLDSGPQAKISRDVTIPDTITVQELANRMAERAADVIKILMNMDVMATITQSIDGETAELVTTEMGHKPHRVSESDVEIGIKGEQDSEESMVPRPPVVTIMGHVDHGKTSLLDAIRATDVVGGEAGGITQHIGAYQVTLPSDKKITFIDTPGHAAFTEMRARGADVTDIVVLVVAADDGIMPQTVEALAHARAAEVPIIIAINKIDLPGANPDRIRQELLQHSLVVEEMGGDVLTVEVSAKTRSNLDKLEEAILLQSEILELKANPDRVAHGAVVESKLERGRGAVATVLVQRGTLHVGDCFVTGCEWGRVRSMTDDRAQHMKTAGPSMPVEVIGLDGTPESGDDFIVVENETRAREIAEFRQRKRREAQAVLRGGRSSLEVMFSKIQAGEKKELPVIVKGDVHGSVEAISSALKKLTEDNTEVSANVMHIGVGAINESDITLARASEALVIGFNVRANTQAREMARRDNVDIRYYSIIYEVIDDVKGMLTGLLAPTIKENFLGYVEIRDVFNITRVGKVAGCMVTEGMVKRGAKVRLLRDDVVIHEGTLKTLKRFKDEVREVKEGYECGLALENYDDIKVGDKIEVFVVEKVKREL
ncbi:MAG: translation initiation factor IF-2 [Pseudomonadota bacterium]|nr:translation initiation factor IF-2 [Pseudomonadota bacterium]